ncbi:MAG: Cobalt uptake substrate-specific transrane region, partial [Pseudomonadota bacterium]
EYYLPYALLLSWGEAFITGMAMALMVAYYPQWVLMFDDKRYLARR